MGVEPLWRVFFKRLTELGVTSICIPKRFKCKWELPQCVTIGVLLGRWRICKASESGKSLGVWNGVRLGSIGGDTECQWLLARECPHRLEISFTPPHRPKFIIDLSLWEEHTARERRELVEQVVATLFVVRSYLWDGNLWITHTPMEFVELLHRQARGMMHYMNIAWDLPPLESPVVLDPEGPCVLTEEDVYRRDGFIIGGIVDKERTAKSATARLARIIGVEERCRIELRGSTIGVPDRVNKIIEILIKTLAGESLEAAILKSQAKRDRTYRLMWEIQRRGKRRGGRLEISREELREINWLGASEEEFALALKKTHAVVI